MKTNAINLLGVNKAVSGTYNNSTNPIKNQKSLIPPPCTDNANALVTFAGLENDDKNQDSSKSGDSVDYQITEQQKKVLEMMDAQSSVGSSKMTMEDRKNLRQMKEGFARGAENSFAQAQNLAKQLGNPYVQSWHLYLSELLLLKNYINDLDNGIVKHNQKCDLYVPYALQKGVDDDDMFVDPEKRERVKDIVDAHINKVVQEFSTREVSSRRVSLSSPKISSEMVSDMIETYNYYAENGETPYSDDMFYSICSVTQDKSLMKEGYSFQRDVQRALMIDDSDMVKKNHLKIYDEKTDMIWENISRGNDVIYTYDRTDRSSKEHMTSSLVNLINKPGQHYKNLDPDKTDIIVLNDNATFPMLNDLVNEVKHDPEREGRKTVIVGDLGILVARNKATIFPEDFKTLRNEDDGNEVRFALSVDKENYFANTAKGAVMQPYLARYAVQNAASINASDAAKYLTDEAGINYIENETDVRFEPEVIQKAVELTAAKEGNYPEKAIQLLSMASKFYVDRDEITPEDLEEYAQQIESLSDVKNDTKDCEIIHDTGKRLDDIIGSPMTKADASNIVKQIEMGTMRTKGFVAYLENGSAYGGGRRHTAEAIAGEAGIPMLTINAKDFALKDIDALSQDAGLSERKIKKLVSNAKAQAEANPNKTAMIFIENFDNFGSDPLYGVSSIYEQKAFSQLLSEMENVRKRGDVNLVVVGSVNIPEIIDPNILKPYKFLDTIIVYPPQDHKERKEVLEYYADKMNIKIGKDEEEREKLLENISRITMYFTIVDLMYLLETVKSVAVERNKDVVDYSDLTEAFLQTTTGRANTKYVSDASKKIVTTHEMGHAIVLQLMDEIAQKQDIPWFMPDHVSFVTLDPRGSYGGATYHLRSDNKELNFETMISSLVCSYGGYSTEKLIYGMDGSWGITSDMSHVTSMAELAVTDMGMGPKTGTYKVPRDSNDNWLVSNRKMQDIEDDIEMITTCAKDISDIIVENYRGFLDEFTEKYYTKVATGECIISAETFHKELEEWRNKQSEEKLKELNEMEKDISRRVNDAKVGAYVSRAKEAKQDNE